MCKHHFSRFGVAQPAMGSHGWFRRSQHLDILLLHLVTRPRRPFSSLPNDVYRPVRLYTHVVGL